MHTPPIDPRHIPIAIHFAFYGVVFAYFLPTVVAVLRRHTHAAGVFILNLLLGWTVIGWLIAQIWSFTNDPPDVKATFGLKATRVILVLCYALLFSYVYVFVRTEGGHKTALFKHHTATQSSPEMTPMPQSGIPTPAGDLLGQ